MARRRRSEVAKDLNAEAVCSDLFKMYLHSNLVVHGDGFIEPYYTSRYEAAGIDLERARRAGVEVSPNCQGVVELHLRTFGVFVVRRHSMVGIEHAIPKLQLPLDHPMTADHIPKQFREDSKLCALVRFQNTVAKTLTRYSNDYGMLALILDQYRLIERNGFGASHISIEKHTKSSVLSKIATRKPTKAQHGAFLEDKEAVLTSALVRIACGVRLLPTDLPDNLRM